MSFGRLRRAAALAEGLPLRLSWQLAVISLLAVSFDHQLPSDFFDVYATNGEVNYPQLIR